MTWSDRKELRGFIINELSGGPMAFSVIRWRAQFSAVGRGDEWYVYRAVGDCLQLLKKYGRVVYIDYKWRLQ